MIQIPNYTVKKVIGQGGMALVYLATQDMLSREVALKVLMPDMMKDDTLRKSFLNEAKIVASLDHPNIVSIYDIGIVDDTIFYMTMEYVKGSTLKEKLLEKKFSYQEAVNILKEITAGLSYAHDKGYIHRDIKPGNILFRDNGVAVLTDFGIAKLQDSSGDLTRLGLTAGTAQYMSPEQAKSLKLDTRSDIYSLGLVFFEILTGEKSFKFDTHHQAIQQHISAPTPKLPKEYAFLQPIINKALAKKPSKRYQSAPDFLKAVEKAGKPSLDSTTSTSSTIHTDKTIIHGTDQSLISILKKKTYLPVFIGLGLMFFGLITFGLTKYYNKTDTPSQIINIQGEKLSLDVDNKKDENNPKLQSDIPLESREQINPQQEKSKKTLSTIRDDDDNKINKPSECKGKVFINGIQVNSNNGTDCKSKTRAKAIVNTAAVKTKPSSDSCKNLSELIKEELSTIKNSDDNVFGMNGPSGGFLCAQNSLYHELKIFKKAIKTGDYEMLDKFVYPPIKKDRSQKNMAKIIRLPYLPDDKVTTHSQIIELPFRKYSKGIYAKTSFIISMNLDFSLSKEELQQTIKDDFLKEAQKIASESLEKEHGAFDIHFKKNTLEATFYKKGNNLAIFEIGKGWTIITYDSTSLKTIKDDLPKEIARYLIRSD